MEAGIPATDLAISITVITTTSTTMQPTSVSLHAKEMPKKPLCPIKELFDSDKGNSSVLGECAPDPLNVKVVKLKNLRGH